MTKILVPIGIILFQGCVTSGPQRPEYEASRVIERMEGHDETPKYAVGGETMFEEGQDAVFVNIMTMSGDARPEACMKAAALDAQSEMVKYIKNAITSSGQLNEASVSDDPAYESLTAYLSNGKMSGAKVSNRYWEKREESASSGDRVLRVKCAVKVAIKKSVLEKQLRDAMSNAPKGNPEIREKLIEGQKNFIESLSEGAAEAH